jgi:hypothetical protein
VSRSRLPIITILLLLLTVPSMGASCVPLWILADRECRRARAAGAEPTRDARYLLDVGVAGTIVFVTVLGLMVLYSLCLFREGGRDLR